MTTFYIANAGLDTNPGTQAQPWKTIAKVNAHTMVAGDAYLFNGGDTFNDAVLTPNTGGASGNPITFSSYGSGNAIIGSNGAVIVNLQWVTISNLNFVGGNATNTSLNGIGIYTNTANNAQYAGILITGCDITTYGGYGIYVGNNAASGNNPGFSGLTISNCVLHANGSGFLSYSNGTGIHSHTNLSILNCVVHDNAGGGGVQGDGIALSGCAGALISGCVAYHNGASSTTGPVGIYCYESDSVVIKSCESYNNTTSSGSDGGGLDIDGGCTNCIIEYCYCHGNRAYGYLLWAYTGVTTSNNTIRFCVSENDGVGGLGAIYIGGPAAFTGGMVYGCTIYQSLASVAVVGIQTSGAACVFYNNIFYAANGYRFIDTAGITPSVTFAGNDYYSSGTPTFNWAGTSYATFAAWQTATGQEKVSGTNVGLTFNPGLTNPGNGGTVNTGSYVTPAMLAGLTAYTLGAGSMMFHAGLNLTTNFSISPGPQDFYSNPINAASLSVGAASPINLGAVTGSVVLADYTLQNGLNALASATNIEVCFAQPTTYLQAATTYNLGTAAHGVGLFGAPVSAGGNGQQVTSVAITNGMITAVGGGTASWFAVTDHVNSRLLASIPLASPAAVGAGQTFSFQTTITIPAVAPAVSALTAASLVDSSPAFTSKPLNNKLNLTAASLVLGSPVFSTPGAGVFGVPVVTNAPFSITLPFTSGETIGTMSASNSPTSWSISAVSGDAATTADFAISSTGVITATAAAVAGVTAAGTVTITVGATNSSGTGTGTATLTISAAGSDPYASVDGSPNAPTSTGNPLYNTITTQFAGLAFSSLLNGYRNASTAAGRYKGPDPTDGKQYQPPWKVAGVDYPVGINASALPLTPASSYSQAGVTVSGHTVTVNSPNVTINGVDFSVGGGYQLVAGGGATNLIVQNCYFQVGTNLLPPITGTVNGSVTIQYCVVDINAQNHNYNQTQGGISLNAQTLTLQYNWIMNGCSELIVWGGAGICKNFIFQFNVMGTSGINVATTGLHGDLIQLYIGNASSPPVTSIVHSFNMHYVDSTLAQFQFACQGSGFLEANIIESSCNSMQANNNTMGVNPLKIAGGISPSFGMNYFIGANQTWVTGSPGTIVANDNFCDQTILGAGGSIWYVGDPNGGSTGTGPYNVTPTKVGNINMQTAGLLPGSG